MFPAKNQTAPEDGFDVRTGFNVFYLLVRSYATCFTVFLRRGFGAEAFGLNAIIAVPIMLFYMQAHPESGAMFDFFCLWWVALVLQRAGYFIRRLRGVAVHSHFDGMPWIGVILPFLHRGGAARFLEVPLCVALSGVLGVYDFALGQFVFYGAFALLAKGMIDRYVERKHVQRMQDAAIDQYSRLERWRRGNF